MFDLLLSPLLPLIVSCIAVFGFIKFSKPAPIAERQLSSNLKLLDPVEASKGLSSIVKFSTHFQPDHVIGVNRGGVLLGAWISFVTGVPSVNFHKYGVLRGSEAGPPDFDYSKLSGKILIVDDIARSGGTIIATAMQVLSNCGPDVSVRTAVLVAAETDIDEKSKVEQISHIAYATGNKHLRMPWSISEGPDAANDELDAERMRREFRDVEVKPMGALFEEISKVVKAGFAANS